MKKLLLGLVIILIAISCYLGFKIYKLENKINTDQDVSEQSNSINQINENTIVDNIDDEIDDIDDEIDDSDDSDDEITQEIPKEKAFEYNIECQKYLDPFTERAELIGRTSNLLGKAIFYSPTKNTCIGTFSRIYDSTDYGYTGEDYLYSHEYYVIDVLDNSASWSIYGYKEINSSNFKGCDRVSGFGFKPKKAGKCKTEFDIEDMWREEIDYLKGH